MGFKLSNALKGAAVGMLTPAGPLAGGIVGGSGVFDKKEGRKDFETKSPYEEAIQRASSGAVNQAKYAKSYRDNISNRVEESSQIYGDAERQALQNRLNKTKSNASARGLLYSGLYEGERMDEKRKYLSDLTQQRAQTFDAEKKEALSREIEALQNDFAVRDTLNEQRLGDAAAVNQTKAGRAGAFTSIGSLAGAAAGTAIAPGAGTAIGSGLGGLAGGALGGAFGGQDKPEFADISNEGQETINRLGRLSEGQNDEDIQKDIESRRGLMGPEANEEKLYRESLGGSGAMTDAIARRSNKQYQQDLSSIARKSGFDEASRKRAAAQAYQSAISMRARTLAGQQTAAQRAEMQMQQQRSAALNSILSTTGSFAGTALAGSGNTQPQTQPQMQSPQTSSFAYDSQGSNWNQSNYFPDSKRAGA